MDKNGLIFYIANGNCVENDKNGGFTDINDNNFIRNIILTVTWLSISKKTHN